MNAIAIPGCRHDILGHNLKAIGLLRVLATCADAEHRDPEAEGWWDLDSACFHMRSQKYASEQELVKIFTEHYQPTRLLSAWNKDLGLEKSFASKSGRASDWKKANAFATHVADKTLTGSEAFLQYRESAEDSVSAALDAISSPFVKRDSNNPVFLAKGIAGRAHIFRTYWGYVKDFASHTRKSDLAESTLFGRWNFGIAKKGLPKGKGAPFFPDAIKTYNNGLGWVIETFPFNALDYLLAVEGALALRGAASRTLAANSRRFAAFPFVFDTGEDMVSYTGDIKGTAVALWTPLWSQATTYVELESFLCDAQARLPRKDVRFSAEFARALYAQGVDSGFAGWQEFRFKMRGSDIPWPCTGRFCDTVGNRRSMLLNDALAPLDEGGFLDQFEVWRDKRDKKIKSSSPHYIRADLNGAIEKSVAEPTPENALEVLIRVYAACRRLTESDSLCEKVAGSKQPVRLFGGLPTKPWEGLLHGLEHSPEFQIARSLASITGFAKQGRQFHGRAVFSEVLPLIGSLLPLKPGKGGWYLPERKDRSKQAVWSGTDLSHDLARVLSRRYLDSLDDERPAIMSPRPAPLEDILAFLNGELDDHRIARWTEALSLIGWHFEKDAESADPSAYSEEQSLEDEQRQLPSVPLAYAALRSAVEMECECQGNDPSLWKKRRSHRPVALLCQRTPSSLALAVEDALRWLAIWGVPNCWGEDARREKARLGGQDIIRADHREFSFGEAQSRLVTRLAAAILIPLDWRDRGKLYRAVTLPQSIKH